MKLREALIQQSPSLGLQRGAQTEIARLDASLAAAEAQLLLCKIIIRDVATTLRIARREQASTEAKRLLADAITVLEGAE